MSDFDFNKEVSESIVEFSNLKNNLLQVEQNKNSLDISLLHKRLETYSINLWTAVNNLRYMLEEIESILAPHYSIQADDECYSDPIMEDYHPQYIKSAIKKIEYIPNIFDNEVSIISGYIEDKDLYDENNAFKIELDLSDIIDSIDLVIEELKEAID